MNDYDYFTLGREEVSKAEGLLFHANRAGGTIGCGFVLATVAVCGIWFATLPVAVKILAAVICGVSLAGICGTASSVEGDINRAGNTVAEARQYFNKMHGDKIDRKHRQ